MENEYTRRINQTLDYMEKNLEKPVSLEELAEAACFSKFHFSRIFAVLMNETPIQCLNRLRIEKAAYLIVSNSQMTCSEVAEATGYSNLAIFSRNFKARFGISPTHFRESRAELSNNRQTESNFQQTRSILESYFCPDSNKIKWRSNMELNKKVEIMDFPKTTVAYIRHIGPYMGDEKLFERLWNELFLWADQHNLLNREFKTLVMYHDDPNVTETGKLRMSVCMTIPEKTSVNGKVGKMIIEPGKYVAARFELTANDFGKAWSWLYGEWFPASGYQPDDKPGFELYAKQPKNGKFVVDLCVPVKTL